MTAGRRLALSGAVGVGCYLLVYAAVGGLFALDFSAHVSPDGGAGDPLQSLKRLGWVVYNAHHVRTRAWLALNFIELAADELLVPAVVYYAIPPLVLTGGGWLAAGRAHTGAGRVLAGAAVAAGYLPAATAGAVATSTPDVAPEFVPAVLLAGIAYPVAFGTVGGLLADR